MCYSCPSENRLGLELCQGYSLELTPRAESSGQSKAGSAPELRSHDRHASEAGHAYPDGAPSLLGSTYIANQGGQSIIVGATKRYGVEAQEAMEACGRKVDETEVGV